jgi:cytochrome c oxidase subunit 2
MINQALGMVPNASEHGVYVDAMLEACHWFMAALFIGWSSYFVYTLWRFSKSRNPKADYHGVQSKASAHLEFSVVVIEAILLLGFALPLWGKRVNGDNFTNNPESIKLHAVAQQFTWNFHYPGPDGKFGRQDPALISANNPLGLDPNDPDGQDDIVVANEMHLVDKRPVVIEVSSKDVIHNLALKHMRMEQDAIPGSRIPMWFRPIRTGTFEMVCGQLCGTGHGGMVSKMIVETQAEYDAWFKEQTDLQHPKAAAPAGAAPAATPAPAAAPVAK